MDRMDILYRINDVISDLCTELGVTFASPEDEDCILDDATFAVYEILFPEGEDPDYNRP